jgi:hypothetical protein
MTLRNISIVALLVLGFAGCNRRSIPNTPEGTLEKYVNAAFEVKSLEDRKTLLDLSAGDAKAYLEQVKDEDFTKQFIDSKLRFVSMKATDLREQSNGDVSLAYELNFQERSNANAPTVHTNKKIAYLGKDELGNWKIKSTKNIKTFIEKKEDLVITPSETTN